MKVLHVCRQTYGGMASHLDALDICLQSLGHVCERIQGEVVPIAPGFWSDRKFLATLRKEARGVDVVHAHGYVAAWLCAGLRQTPWVFTAHSPPKQTPPELVARLNRARAGICVSPPIRDRLSTSGVGRLCVNPGGILLDEWPSVPQDSARAVFRLPIGIPIISALGRLVPEKGIDSLLRAMETVWADHPEAVLLIAGAGPEKASLQEIARRVARPVNVRLLGKWPSASEVICAADLFVMPSRSEGLGLAAIEAMALGTPVLARRAGGLEYVVEDGISGALFDTDDELGQCISELLSVPSVRESYKSAARIRVERDFDMRANAEEIVKIYQAALAG